jgi:hypothetical protein
VPEQFGKSGTGKMPVVESTAPAGHDPFSAAAIVWLHWQVKSWQVDLCELHPPQEDSQRVPGTWKPRIRERPIGAGVTLRDLAGTIVQQPWKLWQPRYQRATSFARLGRDQRSDLGET